MRESRVWEIKSMEAGDLVESRVPLKRVVLIMVWVDGSKGRMGRRMELRAVKKMGMKGMMMRMMRMMMRMRRIEGGGMGGRDGWQHQPGV